MNGGSVRMSEQIDDLQCGGLRIIQKKGAFRYGTDAVLLANYAADDLRAQAAKSRALRGPVRLLDIGTGTGIIPILLCGKISSFLPQSLFDAVELQPDMAELARRSVQMNGQETRIRVLTGDIREVPYPDGSFDVVTMNPPYIRRASGLLNTEHGVAVARHEIAGTQEELVARAAALLKPRGRFYMVNKPDRLADTLCAMRACRLEPRALTMVHAKTAGAPVLFLLLGIRNGGKQLAVLPPIILERTES